MPQAARKEAVTQRVQDKESKRARGALSCAECRRLKLKCDKTVPCSSCKRRGCSAICPNGSLITGQGTRFVLADTEKLHEKIAQMSDRIRQLEDALTILHSSSGAQEPHPLLDRDFLRIKSSIDLHAAVQNDTKVEDEAEESQCIDAFGTLAIRDDGAATFYGRSAGSESLLIGEAASPSPEIRPSRNISASNSINHTPLLTNGTGSQLSASALTIQQWQQEAAQSNGLPAVLSKLSHAFPLPASQTTVDLEYLISTYLPPWEEAWRLCELYLEQAPWFFGAVTKRQLHEEVLPMWYSEAPRPNVPQDVHIGSSPGGSPGVDGKPGGAHDLAVLFVILCFGALTDINLPAAPNNVQAEHYYDLTKVALSLDGVLDRPPSVATVQSLSLMAIYEGLKSGENSIESTWALMGMATKLAQSIGLHRDCARWKLSPAEVQKRRALFWELFITDCWQSLATGRLATFSLPFVDCELPSDPDQTMSDDGTIQPSFPFWKARFGADCVSAVVQGTLTSRAPKYSIILELDRRVRDMELPKYAQGAPPEGAGLSQTMSHFMPTNYRELTLLYIHRCFFAHAISSNPTDPIKSQYAPSFLAGYRSACDLLGSVKQQFLRFPEQIARFWVLWTHAFSSAVMISSVVTHGPRCKVAPAAILELNSACELFENAARYGGRAGKFLPIVQRLKAKAHKVFMDTCNGVPPAIPHDIFTPSNANGTADDEMAIFSGKTHTHTVVTKASGSRSSSTRSPASNGSARSSQSPNGSPGQSHTTNPSFAGVHPSLVHELHGFDGHINAQIQNAYNTDHVLFNQPLSQQTSHAVVPHETPQQAQHQQPYVAEPVAHQQYEPRQHSHSEMETQKHMEEQMMHQREEEERRRRLAEEEAYAQAQQRQQQQQQQHYSYDGSAEPYSNNVSPIDPHPVHGVPLPAPSMPDHRRTLSHSRSRSNLHRVTEYHPYQQQQQQAPPSQYPYQRPEHHPQHRPQHHPLHHPQHQPQNPPNTEHLYQASQPHQLQPVQAQPPQHEMYPIPPEFMQQQQQHYNHTSESPEIISPVSSTQSHHYSSPELVFDSHAHPSTHVPHAQVAQVAPPQYWQHHQHEGTSRATTYEGLHQYSHHAGVHPVPLHQSHYTPGAAMNGYAAEDPRLQETWQTYMNKVGSPRHLMED